MPNTLAWTIGQFKAGKLPAMVQRAGYPWIADNMDPELVAAKVAEVETMTASMLKAAGQEPA